MSEKIFIVAKRLEASHLRMARGGLQFSIRDLAALCHVNKATIVRLEAGHPVRESTRANVRKTLEDHGAEFWQCRELGEVVVGINQA